MATKRARKSEKTPSTAKRQRWSANRGRKIKANGGVTESLPVAAEPNETITVGEAMRRAVESLGSVTISDELAPQQLRELGTLYEEVASRQAAYDAKAEEAKTAKKSLEVAQEMLLSRVKEFTHPSPLPLFDTTQAEGDLAAMVDGGEVTDAQLDAVDAMHDAEEANEATV